ncbi:MAG: ABC transporter permease [Oligoflexales bacterium]|nr:ABC transporter permease [Oligoflexales bacterium]
MSTYCLIYFQLTVIAFRNVIKNWRHSLSTLLAISCGFVAISIFDGYLKNFRDNVKDTFTSAIMMGHVIIQKKDAEEKKGHNEWLYSLDSNDQNFLEEFLKNDPDVAARIRFLNISGILNSGRNNPYFKGYGYDIMEGLKFRGDRWGWNVIAGAPLHMAENHSIVLGGGLARSIDCNYPDSEKLAIGDKNFLSRDRPFNCPSKRVTLSVTTEFSQVNATQFPVSGITNGFMADSDKHMINISLEDAWRLMDTKKISMVTVLLKSEDQIPSFIRRASEAAVSRGLKLDIARSSTHRLASYMIGAMKFLTLFRGVFMVILLTIGVMSVVNTMAKAVNERIREIGILRSLGFFRRHLIFMFSLEGSFLSLIACAFGLVATITLCEFIKYVGFKYDAGIMAHPVILNIAYAPWAWAFSVILFSILATGSAWFCSRKACYMVVAEAMRHVE